MQTHLMSQGVFAPIASLLWSESVDEFFDTMNLPPKQMNGTTVG